MEKQGLGARCSVAAILLVGTPACDLGDTETIDIEGAGESGAAAEDAQELVGRAEALPAPNEVWIENISSFGVGCPLPNSALGEYGSANQTISLTFKDMLLQHPGGAPLKTTNCVASVKLHIPSGWQMSAADIKTKGRAFLDNGIKARNTITYFFAGDPIGYTAQHQLVGPYRARYTLTDQIPHASVVWSPCGGSVIFGVDTSMVLNAISNPTGAASNKLSKVELQIQLQEC